MEPGDIVVDEQTPLGTKALRDYLDYAKRGVLATTDEGDREPDSDFEISVANVLRNHGYEVKPQLGVAGFFLDMAVRNPDKRGEFLAGIECDGATYHSGTSVRDRDRIRQQILENLGWKDRIYRIWSTDWFYNPHREIAKMLAFLDARRQVSTAEDETSWNEDALAAGGDISAQGSDALLAEDALDDVAGSLVFPRQIGEDIFVEVGDSVTYCFADDPSERHTVMIVESESNARRGIINELTPIAQALLGLSPGDVGEIGLPGQTNRSLHVIKVTRQETLVD